MAVMKHDPQRSGLVYSTDAGRMCPGCRRPMAQCSCQQTPTAPAGDGIVRVSRETKGRNGKCVTVIRGLPLEAAALAKLGRELKALCGSGGTAGNGVIEVQGDHAEKLAAHLTRTGWVVRRAGG
ncbi:MAG: stress response translation initiation inhibitor YciH [Pseudomonadota bacterium]|jgi:translation initiation factor 1